jgi:hypothetical protein
VIRAYSAYPAALDESGAIHNRSANSFIYSVSDAHARPSGHASGDIPVGIAAVIKGRNARGLECSPVGTSATGGFAISRTRQDKASVYSQLRRRPQVAPTDAILLNSPEIELTKGRQNRTGRTSDAS